MKKTVRTLLCAIAALPLLAASCSKDTDAMYSKQEKYIEEIVGTLVGTYPEATVDYPGEIVRVTLASGDGEALAKDGKVTLYYAGYRITGGSISASNLFRTNLEELATEVKWATTDPDAFNELTIDMAEDGLIEGLRKGLREHGQETSSLSCSTASSDSAGRPSAPCRRIPPLPISSGLPAWTTGDPARHKQ